MKYLLGMDFGTTSLKAAVFDEQGICKKTVTKDYLLEVKGDMVEFPADAYWKLLQEALLEITCEFDIYAMSIDTQCETIIVTDEEGNPLRNAIVWLDNRAGRQADKIRETFGEEQVYTVTGQPEITPTWPASKLLWIREEEPEVFCRMKKIFLLEDYLLYQLTGRFVTEETLQSSTLYYDVRNHCYWDEMLDFLEVKRECLPEVLKSAEKVGEYQGIQVVTSAMDQVAGAIGAGVVEKGIISEMTGTTMTIFVPSEEMPAYRPEGKVPCHLNYDGKYCLLMWTQTAGMTLKWFKNQFCPGESFEALNLLAEKVPAGSEGLTFLPYLCGAPMPRYNPDAKGVFYGITMEHTKGHFVRSIFEAVSCTLKCDLDYLQTDCSEVRTMGGAAKSPLWCQIKADMTGKTFVTLNNEETACLGSAILAGVACGVFENVEAACTLAVQKNKIYRPSGEDYRECYERYSQIAQRIFP